MFYTYIFRKPCGEPYYVGYSKNLSRIQHLGRNELCNRITKSILRAGHEPEVEIISLSTKEAAIAKEIELISRFGRISDGTGTLANHTNGGEGLQEYIFTDLHRQRISEAKKGVPFSDDHRKQLSISASKRTASDETRKKMSDALAGGKMPSGHGEKVWATRRLREEQRRNALTEEQRNEEDRCKAADKLALEEQNRVKRKQARQRRREERLNDPEL